MNGEDQRRPADVREQSEGVGRILGRCVDDGAGLIMITLEYTVNTIEHCYHEFESIGVSLIMNVNLLSPALSRI